MKLNFKFLLAFVCLLAIETLIALFVRDQWIRPFVGDILVVILIYCLIKTFVARRVDWLPAYIFLFAVLVEISQYFNLAQLLQIEDNRFATTIIGSTFDWKDILCYFIGCLILTVFHQNMLCKGKSNIL